MTQISVRKEENSVNWFTKGSVLRRCSATAAVWNFQIIELAVVR